MAAQFRDRRNAFIMASLKYANAYITALKEEDSDEEIEEELIDECGDLYTNFELVNKDIDKELEEDEEEKKGEDQEVKNARKRNQEDRLAFKRLLDELLKHCSEFNFKFFFKAQLKYAQLLQDIARRIGYKSLEDATVSHDLLKKADAALKLAQHATETNEYYDHDQDWALQTLPDELSKAILQHEAERILVWYPSEMNKALASPPAEQSPFVEILAQLETAVNHGADLQDDSLIARTQGALGHVLYKGKYETLESHEEKKGDELKEAQKQELEKAQAAYSKMDRAFGKVLLHISKEVKEWRTLRTNELMEIKGLIDKMSEEELTPEQRGIRDWAQPQVEEAQAKFKAD